VCSGTSGPQALTISLLIQEPRHVNSHRAAERDQNQKAQSTTANAEAPQKDLAKLVVLCRSRNLDPGSVMATKRSPALSPKLTNALEEVLL